MLILLILFGLSVLFLPVLSLVVLGFEEPSDCSYGKILKCQSPRAVIGTGSMQRAYEPYQWMETL